MGEKGFDIELRAWLLLPESFDIYASLHGLVFEYLLNLIHRLVLEPLGKCRLALDEIIADNIKSGTVLESFDNCRVWLEMAHALERMDGTNGNGEVVMPLDLLEQEFVLQEIGVREIKFDLEHMR